MTNLTLDYASDLTSVVDLLEDDLGAALADAQDAFDAAKSVSDQALRCAREWDNRICEIEQRLDLLRERSEVGDEG